MNTPLISIIIPVYNAEAYLKECIDSALSQTYTKLEIILIDDGSSDNSPSICDEYVQKDNRIIVIHQKNKGPSETRNTGINISKGEYLSFLDCDDILHPEYISKLFYAIDNSKEKISLCNNLSFSDTLPSSSKEDDNIKEIELLDIFDIQNSMCVWGKLYHKTLFADIQYPIGKLPEDEFVTYKILYKAHKVAYCNSVLYFYRNRHGSIMKNKKESFYINLLDALLENYNFFYSHKEYKICEKFLLRLTYLNTDYNHFLKSNTNIVKTEKNISKIIFNLPKKKISLLLQFKVFIKTTLIYIFKLH